MHDFDADTTINQVKFKRPSSNKIPVPVLATEKHYRKLADRLTSHYIGLEEHLKDVLDELD